MQGDQVTDKNLCLAIINQLKWDATCLTSKILECADSQLRQDYMDVLNRTFAEQKQAFDFAQQHGWYQPMMAEQTTINQVQSDTQKMMQEQQQSMMSIHQQAQYQAVQTPQNMYNANQNYTAFQNYNTMPAYSNQQNYGSYGQQFYNR